MLLSLRWMATAAGLGLCLIVPAFGAVTLPRSAVVPTEVRVVGEPLEAALPRIGGAYQIRLSASPEMRNQRVTLFSKGITAEAFGRDLAELLSAETEARVAWKSGTEGEWRLEESMERRKLKERLKDADLDLYRKFLEEQTTWAREKGRAELAAKAGGLGSLALLERLAHGLYLDSLGQPGRESLLSGKPAGFRIGDLPPELRDLFRQLLVARHRLGGEPVETLDRYRLVYLMARHPYHPRGSHLLVTVITPEGQAAARHGQFTMPYPAVLPASYGPFELLPPPAEDRSRRVTFVLTPERNARPGSTVLRNLDEVLEVVARECGVNVVADGYLRPPREFPANFKVQDYPLATLLNALCRPYGCRWRFTDATEKTLLVRAEHWWMEDATDVPDAVAQELRRKLGPGKDARLADLLHLAELPGAQVHRLIETGICTAADGLVQHGWYDAASPAQPWLQFYSRLPTELRARAQTPGGLPLKDAPQDLVDAWLTVPLAAGVGAVTREERAGLAFLLTPVAGPPGYEVAVRRPDGTRWLRRIPRWPYFFRRIHEAVPGL